jgi:predicted glutamine amidotransferase
MCGILGFITKEKAIGAPERKRWFLNAIRAGVVRGNDGTGMFLVEHDHKGTADWCKMGAPPETFLATEAALARTTAGDWAQYRAVIGHNRSATIGSVNTANAHPFQEGPITLVHNGTLNTTHNLPMPKNQIKGADVDSHMITHNLATHSVKDVVKQLDGAFVLVWHDARDQSVNIVRNEKRPLHMLPLKHHDTLLIASEAEMLWWLTDRSSFTPAGEMYYPESGQWLKFLPDSHKPHVSKLDLHTYVHGWQGGRGRAWDADDDYGPWYGHVGGRGYSRGATGEGPNTGKAPSPPQQGGLYINDAALNRRIPKPLSRTLDDYKLDCRDKLRLEVVTVDPVHGTGSAVVKGRLLDVEGKPWAHLYGLSYEAVKVARDGEIWTVAPNGVKDIGGGLRPVVLARLLSRSSISPQGVSSEVNANPKPSDNSSPKELPNGCTEEVLAFTNAAGEQITKEMWCALTVKGCCYCEEPLLPEFVADVWWTTDTNEPICGDCAAELMDEEVKGDDIDYSKAV